MSVITTFSADRPNVIIMQLYWPFLVINLIRSSESNNHTTKKTDFAARSDCKMPLILNGHYISWPSTKAEEKYIKKQQFIPKNIIYTKFQMCADRIFLAAPRYRRGVPFTLGYMELIDRDKCYNYVKPFPVIEKQDVPDKTVTPAPADSEIAGLSLINAIDLVMAPGPDSTLWVLDIGITDTLSGHPTVGDDPKILGFNPITGKIMHSITLRTLTNRTPCRLQHLMVENVNKSRTMLYVGDGDTRSIIVWNVQGNAGHRVKIPHTSVVGCADNNPNNDVFYMALIELKDANYIYFTYLSGQNVFRAKTNHLNKNTSPRHIVNIGKKPCKMVFLGVGYGSVLFFRIKDDSRQYNMYSWDTKHTFLEENFVMVRKSIDRRTITHMDIDNKGVVWILESNIQDYITNHVGCFGPSIMLAPIADAPANPIILNNKPSDINPKNTTF